MITETQKKEILESPCYELFCDRSEKCSECAFVGNDNCEEIYDLIKRNGVLEFQLSEEKAKTKKLKETLEFYAEIQEANDELTLEDGERLYVVDIEDFELVEWTHTCGSSYKVKTIGKRARQALKELEE